MFQIRRRPASIFTTAVLCLAAITSAQTTVIVPCSQDNTLFQSAAGSLSNGRGNSLFVGVTGQPQRRRSLVQFDIASLVPAGARILDARLGVEITRTIVGFDVDVFVHRVLQAWGEGSSNAPGQEGQGTAATAGSATWVHRLYPSNNWSTPGGDFSPTPSAVIRTPTFGNGTSALAQGIVADAQSMLDNPAQNFGWLLKTDEVTPYVTRRFNSREATSSRPTLTVSYLLPGQTANWGTGCLVSGVPFTLAVSGAPVGGGSVQLVQSQGPMGALAANVIALDFDRAGTQLLPQCRFHLPLPGPISTHNVLLLDGSGGGATPFAVPMGFAGVLITSQSVALAPTPEGYVSSNAVIMLLQ